LTSAAFHTRMRETVRSALRPGQDTMDYDPG
jgi:hypothetical protein